MEPFIWIHTSFFSSRDHYLHNKVLPLSLLLPRSFSPFPYIPVYFPLCFSASLFPSHFAETLFPSLPASLVLSSSVPQRLGAVSLQPAVAPRPAGGSVISGLMASCSLSRGSLSCSKATFSVSLSLFLSLSLSLPLHTHTHIRTHN